MTHPYRLLFDPSGLNVQDILLVGKYHYPAAQAPLLPHSHEDALEICYLERGSQIYKFGENDLHCLRGGEVLVAKPQDIHSTGQLPEFPGQLYWLQIRIRPIPTDLLGLQSKESEELQSSLLRLPRQFRGTRGLRDLFEKALDPIRSSNSHLKAIEFKCIIIQLLLECIAAASHGEQQALPYHISRALRIVEEEPMNRISVTDLARRAQLSESYFKLLFRKTMGMPPAEFLRVWRLEHAQLQLINTDVTITDIALACGFSSSQHFATAFRKQFGCSPRDFRARRTNESSKTSPLTGSGVKFHPARKNESSEQ